MEEEARDGEVAKGKELRDDVREVNRAQIIMNLKWALLGVSVQVT